jgi:hypothetical protein
MIKWNMAKLINKFNLVVNLTMVNWPKINLLIEKKRSLSIINLAL